MKRTLQPLAPAEAKRSGDGEPPPSVVAKRKPVSIACDNCRKFKTRCDGARPVCARCRDRGVVCVYEAEQSRKMRLEMLEAQRDAVTQENSRLWRLYRMLQTLPQRDAENMLRQLRSTDDPLSLLRLARSATPPLGSGAGFVPREQGEGSARLLAINLHALAKSLLKVPAHPWTSVAGDGVVSDLISSFFKWDDAFFFPFIDQEVFLNDMRSSDAHGARFCSPFLVNAICASRSFTSRMAKECSAALGYDIGAKFLNEAKKLWHLENNRASIPNVQALAILFTVSAYRGADRQGLVYRFSAYEMLSRLDLPGLFSRTDDESADGRRTRAIISKTLWGLFCFERAYVNELLISTWHAALPNVAVEEGQRRTAGNLVAQCAIRDTELSKQYIQQYGLSELDDATLHSAFIEACAMIRRTAADFPMARFILQGVMAIAWSLDVAIPARALPYLQNLGTTKDELVDIPLGFVIPETVLVRKLLTFDTDESEEDLRDMGKILSKWSTLTID